MVAGGKRIGGAMDGNVIELSGDLRAGAAADLRDRLRQALEAGDLQVATGALQAVDCAIVQVLVSAGRTAAQLDRKLQIDGQAQGALGAMLDRLGLAAATAGATQRI